MNSISKTGWAIRLGTLPLTRFLSSEAHAAGITLKDYTEINSVILCPIARDMFWVLIAISTIMILVSAYMYVTAGGDPEKVGKATKTITYSAVGVVVALLARAFPLVIASIFNADLTAGSACQ